MHYRKVSDLEAFCYDENMNQQGYEVINETSGTPLVILFIVIGTIAFIVMVAYLVRLWLVQSATFKMQKDLAEIKEHLLNR